MKKIIAMLMLMALTASAKHEKVVTVKSIAQNFTSGWVDVGSPIDMQGFDALAVAVKYTPNNSLGMRIRAVGKMTYVATDIYEFPILTASLERSTYDITSLNYRLPDLAINAVVEMKLGSNGLIPFVQLQIKADTVGGTAGTLDNLKVIYQ